MRQLIIVVGVLLLSSVASAQQRAITPKNWVISADAAFKWVEQVATPILLKHADDPKELPAVKNRIAKLRQMLEAKQLEYLAEPFFYHGSKTSLGHTDYDRTARRPVLMIFVPAWQAYQKTVAPGVFENEIVLAYAHEMIHVEHMVSGEFPSTFGKPWGIDGMREEAAAWGQTILEIIRPWNQQGRALEPSLMKLSEQLAEVKDDYKDARWVLTFSNYETRLGQ
ncbi:MAG: hypothetical protein ABI643_01280 [Candidatus Doudnabacteria bacterium]